MGTPRDGQHARNRLDQAHREAGEALRHAERSGLAHQLGTAHHAWAVLLDAMGDIDAATEHARTAVGRFTKAGSPHRRGDRASTPGRPARARWPTRGDARRVRPGLATLTAREREVVDLVTAGLTNREIAERLYLSRKTVETHLSRAFTKLHVRSRVDLTRRVTESG